ncbi:MAG: zinc-binding alcohol dehydrogenase [Anaerolineae bacterium]|nr:zinc-binding alcohol dehydrogenase [Anaerolineae bacterium]
MPRKLICVGRERLEWQAYEDAPLASDQVRVRAEYGAAKHGTEMALFKGYAFDRGPFDEDLRLFRGLPEGQEHADVYQAALGNMIVGRVVERGDDVTALKLGQRVCLYSGFRDTVTALASACWPMPEKMPWRSAVCLDPADFALGAVRDGHVRAGDAVAVFGLGAIGLMVVQILRLAGAGAILAVDPVAARRDVAAGLGADVTLDPTSCDVGLELKERTGGRGVDVAIDYSGARAALQACLRGVAYGGTVVAGSFPSPYGAGLDLGAEAHMNVPNLVFSRACSEPHRDYPRWDERRLMETCWRWLAEGRLTGELIVQPVISESELLEAYPRVAGHPEAGIKLGVVFETAREA